MARKRVIAYVFEPEEARRIADRMQGAVVTPSHVSGWMEEEEALRLEEEGVPLDIFEARAEEPASAAPAAPRRSVPSPAGLGLDGSAPPRSGAGESTVYEITLAGAVLAEEWREELARLGCRLLERLPEDEPAQEIYLASAPAGNVPAIEALDCVSSIRPFTSDPVKTFTARKRAPTRGPFALAAPEPPRPFDVLLHDAEGRPGLEEWLRSRGVEIAGSTRRKVRVLLEPGSPLAGALASRPEVRRVEEYVEPKLANGVAREILGLAPGEGGSSAPLPWTGEGEIVGVADSGLDDAHPDFAGRIAGKVARGRPGDTSDPHGHGTHVAGSAVGDGSASGGAHGGTAPKARLFFQSLMDANGGLGGLPLDLAELFQEAYDAGVRVHNNSWSADTRSFYTFNSLEVDEFIAEHPDLLVVIAAGNEASAASPINALPGFVDWQSVGSPATSKNALTVGASRSSRQEGGIAQSTWRQFKSSHFPTSPIADERISGDPECLAAFSGRGPSDPRRIKPDLVAPGTDILSARASTAPDSSFWGLVPGEPHYGFMGGTSMATPLVTGCAALVREYYRKERGLESPSAALLKATLINGTRRLTGEDALADHEGLPNYHQGFGLLYMPYVLPSEKEPWMRLSAVDTWRSTDGEPTGGALHQTGAVKRYRLQVNGGKFLRLCLAWTDPAAGASVQNQLGLQLQHPGLTPAHRFSNPDGAGRIGRLDRDNNVQILRIEDPPPGECLVQVFAANLLAPPQDFALVVTGDLGGELTEV